MSNLNIKNKKAWFEYEIIERIVTQPCRGLLQNY